MTFAFGARSAIKMASMRGRPTQATSFFRTPYFSVAGALAAKHPVTLSNGYHAWRRRGLRHDWNGSGPSRDGPIDTSDLALRQKASNAMPQMR
jgi:hypothetical protein